MKNSTKKLYVKRLKALTKKVSNINNNEPFMCTEVASVLIDEGYDYYEKNRMHPFYVWFKNQKPTEDVNTEYFGGVYGISDYTWFNNVELLTPEFRQVRIEFLNYLIKKLKND